MPTITEARASIYTRMEAQWNVANGALYAHGEAAAPGGAAFVRLSVFHSTSSQRTLGATGDRRFRRAGNITVQCFAAPDAGIKGVDVMANLVKDIFEAVEFGELDTYAATMREAPAEDGRYIGILVTIPFDYDEIR